MGRSQQHDAIKRLSRLVCIQRRRARFWIRPVGPSSGACAPSSPVRPSPAVVAAFDAHPREPQTAKLQSSSCRARNGTSHEKVAADERDMSDRDRVKISIAGYAESISVRVGGSARQALDRSHRDTVHLPSEGGAPEQTCWGAESLGTHPGEMQQLHRRAGEASMRTCELRPEPQNLSNLWAAVVQAWRLRTGCPNHPHALAKP